MLIGGKIIKNFMVGEIELASFLKKNSDSSARKLKLENFCFKMKIL